MGVFDSLFKKRSDEIKIEEVSHKSKIGSKAKALIEELVSPLSKPNQKIIDEVLTIITQTAELPDSMVNKSEVQRITKKLLFELVEPISNPNKQLIDELVQLINLSGSIEQKEKTEIKNEPVKQDESNQQNSSEEKPERIMKGQAGLKQKQMEAIAQAPYPQDIALREKKDKETKSIMNLLLEQIKELITITNGLNSKLKTHQVRIDSFDSSINDIKKKSQDFDDRMIAFEKNMEKFIGLYEVVTNQYNPFVETTDVFSDDTKQINKFNGEDISNINVIEKEPEIQKTNDLIISNTKINDLSKLSDALIFMSEDDFKNEILSKKEFILKWISEVLKNEYLKNELNLLGTRNEWIKTIIRSQN